MAKKNEKTGARVLTPPGSGGRKTPARRNGRPDRKTDLSAAARADTPGNLLAFQRTLKDALIRPLAPGERTRRAWTDGRPMAEFAAEFIKGNDRLTALERLQIYNRMYWFRLLDCFYDDNPGLHALLGVRRFAALAEAYLTKHPSTSFTLRNLCGRLADFIRTQPAWTAPHTALALDVARFEWAQTVAFDEAARPVMTTAEIAGTPPSKLKLALQPHVVLLALEHAVDDYVIAVKRREALRSEASNATGSSRRVQRGPNVRRPMRGRVWLAVHRFDNTLYYKRLEAPAFRILMALQAGQPLTRAIGKAGGGVKAGDVREWFATWMQLGWICRR